MVDMAKILSQQGVIVSFITTPHNASRFNTVIDRAKSESSAELQLVQIPFPWQEVGLPPGCESLDTLSSKTLLDKFYKALGMLQKPIEDFLQKNDPLPISCIISDKCLYWTSSTAQKFNVPRIVFHGMGCFSLLTSHNVKLYKPHLSVSSDAESFLVPRLPHKIKVTKAQLPGEFISLNPDMDHVREKMKEAEETAFGVVVNTFTELEHGFAEEYKRSINKKIWCIGPLSACNKKSLDKFERGNKARIDEQKCLEWLDSMNPGSVIYACLGSLCRLVPRQLIELGLGLESSNRPFIWVIKTEEKSHEELEKWLEDDKFAERVKDRGLLIKGWAPQILILSHRAIGGFLTHCGWNSVIEGICSGVPMITWPLFSEQFLNEKLIVEVLKIGVRIGVELPVRWGDEEKVGVLVKRNDVENAIDELMMSSGRDDEFEGETRRDRARKLGETARTVMQEGGSSYLNVLSLIEDVLTQSELSAKNNEDQSFDFGNKL